MSKPVLLIIIGAICAGAFLNGLRFAQMDRNPWEGKKLGGMPVQGLQSLHRTGEQTGQASDDRRSDLLSGLRRDRVRHIWTGAVQMTGRPS
jgi:hypothetical protein